MQGELPAVFFSLVFHMTIPPESDIMKAAMIWGEGQSIMKRINEIFDDYNAAGSIGDAVVQAVLIRRKARIFELEIQSDQEIRSDERETLSEWIRQKFALNKVQIRIEYTGDEAARIQERQQAQRQQAQRQQAQGLPPQKNETSVPYEVVRDKPAKVAEYQEPAGQSYQTESKSAPIYGRKTKKAAPVIRIVDITPEEGKVTIEGEPSNLQSKELKSGKTLVIFDVYDGSGSMTCKAFLKPEKDGKVLPKLQQAKGVRVSGNAGYSKFSGEIELIAFTILETEGRKKTVRQDHAKEKRVELHLHTQMSQLDAVSSATDLIRRAMSWGMKSIAITDHGVVQSFPEAYKLLGRDNGDMKVLYGMEAYLVPDRKPSVTHPEGQSLDTTFCVLDLETTGFSPITERITEIGIMKVKDGKTVGEFNCFVNPEKPIPERVVELTHINDDMVRDAETIGQVFPKMLDFIQGSVLVAHNAEFDTGFLKHNAEALGYEFHFTYVDTLSLAKALFPDFKSYKLGRIAKKLGIRVETAHRALDDVDTTVQVFQVMLDKLRKRGAKTLEDIDRYSADEESRNEAYKKQSTYHAIILVKNSTGLRNLYRLVSWSHLDYFYKKPRILKSLYREYSEGLILGTACSEGELYQAILLGKSDEEIEAIAEDYDYLEVQPLGNNDYLVRTGQVPDREYLKKINRKIVALGEKLGKPVAATGDVHFMDPEDEIYRRILEAGQGYKDADNQPPLYFRTTEEMLEEFSYLGEEKAYEIVVTNTNRIADLCEPISPISPEKCPPHIEGCETTIKDSAFRKAHELYGDPLPEIVQSRLDKELDSIIKNGFSVMYMIAQQLVAKSNEDGYLVGSRGSVGSSLVAFMTGITEVNALPPHYRCPNCKHSDFEAAKEGGWGCGADMPDAVCPVCGAKYEKDGFNIPFETFLGFGGDKVPDIDLNFSGEYQASAHRHTFELFGESHVFRAGTIGTVAEKTAFGHVRKYLEERGKTATKAEMLRLAKGCTGVKRTTGQHPGGMVVIPQDKEIYDFCPVQRPADDPDTDIITTHFEYHAMESNLLKLDMLGHDDPSMIRMMEDLSGMDAKTISLDDPDTRSIFITSEVLGYKNDPILGPTGATAIPEFGTSFVRGMLEETKPTEFDILVRLSGFSHGTDVWLGNARDLILSGTATVSQAIGCRDDIMIYLISCGMDERRAFKIMEAVRKGRGLPDGAEDEMKTLGVPEWYIGSCKKIAYLFPKAHAVAYVMMAFRIAWFKVHDPLAFYAAYFSIRAKAFDATVMCLGMDRAKAKMTEIRSKDKEATAVELDMLTTLEVVYEFYLRGFSFDSIDLYHSDAVRFGVDRERKALLPPFMAIPGLGETAALSIVEQRKGMQYLSIEEFSIDCPKVTKTHIGLLKVCGALDGLPDTSQMTLF